MSQNTLTITDNRTGKKYDIPIKNGTIRALDLRQIKVDENDFGMMTYDPAFTNTASCASKIGRSTITANAKASAPATIALTTRALLIPVSFRKEASQ